MFVYVSVCVRAYMYMLCVQVTMEDRRQCPGTGVAGGCESLMYCHESENCILALEEWEVFLIAEPSLEPQHFIFKYL